MHHNLGILLITPRFSGAMAPARGRLRLRTSTGTASAVSLKNSMYSLKQIS
jgi:hypothetical protein